MARPKPTVLLKIKTKEHKMEEVLEADAIYAVFYKGKPISVRLLNRINYPGPKYKKVSFPNLGHAKRLKDRLNIDFVCDDFKVIKLTQGEEVE